MPKISSVPKKLQNLVDVQKKFQPSFCAHEDQLRNWHHVDRNCYDVLALMRKIASLQKLLLGLRPIFALQSYFGLDQLLTWTPPTRLGTLWHPAETENPDQRPNFWSAKNLHSCGVYAQQCAKLPFNSAACSSLLTATTSARKVSKVGKSQRSDLWPSSTFGIRVTGDWGGSVWSCYVLFCSPLLPCCFAHTHNVVVARLDTPRLGLANAGDWEQKPRKWKCKAEKPSDLVFSTVLWYNPYLRIRLSVCVTYIPHVANTLYKG